MDKPTDIDELWDKYLRVLAEKENMRKQHAIELRRARQEGIDGAVREMLPIVDNLERGNASARKVSGKGGLKKIREGFDVVTRHAQSTLNSIGVNPFDCEHQPFDPSRMDAVAQIETDAMQPGQVVGESQRGYNIKDRLLRPAKVAVAVEKSNG